MHHANKTTRILAASLAALATPALLGANDEITELRRQIAELDQKLRVLERRGELAEEAAEQARQRNPVVTAGPTGFSVGSPDRKFQLRIRGNVQVDGRFFVDDGGSPANDGFLLRRVRPSLEGTWGEDIRFRVMPDFAPDTPTLLDAWFEYQPTPAFGLLFGRTKSPLSLERLVSQTSLAFVERAYPASLLPNRDVGVHAKGAILDGRLDWLVGIQKGTQDGASAATSTIRDDDPEFVARFFAHPFAKEEGSALQGLGLGIAVARDRQDGVAPSGYRTLAQQTFFSWANGTAVDGEVVRWSPQASWYLGRFGLLAEYASSSQDLVRGTVRDRLVNTAWQVLGSWVVTGEDSTYRGVVPATTWDPSAGTFGAVELTARLSGLSIDSAAFPAFANPATSAEEVLTGTLGVNWFPNRNLKLTVNLETSDFDGGASGSVTARREKAIFTRAQFSF